MGIINDNDMEIVMQGDQKKVIRKMLSNRLFCLFEMPVDKPEKLTSAFSSSVFFSFINNSLVSAFAIRDPGSKTLYEKCENYLIMYCKRADDEESRRIFGNNVERITGKMESAVVSFPSIDKVITYLNAKELFRITNYMQYGNMEAMKVHDFLEKQLFLWKDSESDFILRDEVCDVRVFLNCISGTQFESGDSFRPGNILNIDVGQRIVDVFLAKSKKYHNDRNYYSAEYVSRTEEIQARYFVTRFHSNTQWDADPVNIVNARISAFLLPGSVSDNEIKTLPPIKITHNNAKGEAYMINSIHVNSDIFHDVAEFEEYLDSYFLYFSFD